MMFLLIALKISYILDLSLPEILAFTSKLNDQLKAKLKKLDEDELLCRGHIVDNLSNHLYHLFISVRSPNEI